jgi:nicotinamide-nucleotide amidase
VADDLSATVAGPAGPVNSEAQLLLLALRLGQRVARDGARIVTAESCTGGAIARALTESAGSSVWFDRGFVTYSNASKTEQLAVDAALLAEFGAVSEPVALAMAVGALATIAAPSPALALAVTGIAGPGGAVPGKPVGTICFGWAVRTAVDTVAKTSVQTVHWDGDRVAVRLAAAAHALTQALVHWEAAPN